MVLNTYNGHSTSSRIIIILICSVYFQIDLLCQIKGFRQMSLFSIYPTMKWKACHTVNWRSCLSVGHSGQTLFPVIWCRSSTSATGRNVDKSQNDEKIQLQVHWTWLQHHHRLGSELAVQRYGDHTPTRPLS